MSNEKITFSFLQISDILLDARLSFKDMDMPASKRHERNSEAFEAILNQCQIAKDRHADALVVVGNLWDSQSVTAATVARLVDAFASLGDIPVLINPGTSDPLNAQSFYSPNVVSAFALRPWSKNVCILSATGTGALELPARKEVFFVAPGQKAGLKAAGAAKDRCLIGFKTVETQNQMAEVVADKELAYTAFGGMPNFAQVLDNEGNLRGAASGSLIGRSLKELGSRCALWVQLTRKTNGTGYNASLEKLVSDKRSIISLPVKINGIKAQNVADHIKKALAASGSDPGDLLHLCLSGIYPAGSAPDLGAQQLARECFHLIMEDRTRPDYYLDKMDPRTTEGRFIQFLQDLKVKAEVRGGTAYGTEYDTELTPSIIEDALYYGLEALNRKKVTVPDVD